jgi:flagellar hook-associated protein 2
MTTTSATGSNAASTAAAAASATPSNSSIGQSILTTLNANGTGIDTNSLITNLTAAEKSSLESPITTKQTAVAAQISEVATITNDLTTFSSSLNTLVSGGTLLTQPNSSDNTVLQVSALANSSIGDLTGTVNVTQLAQAQTLESQPIASGTAYASGTLSITTTGGKTVSLTAGTDFTDLASLAKAVNAQTKNSGISANIVTDSAGSHLVLKGTTGSAQGFSITGTDDASGFAYTPVTGDTATANTATGTGMQRVQVAQDATFTVDGVAYTRASNTVSDAINGVKMVLTKTGTATLSSTRPTSAITEAVNDFVAAYNVLKGELSSATAAATSSSDAGPLRGNNTIRQLQAQLSKLTTTPLNASGNIRTLAELGVKTANDGTLSVDSAKLANMLNNYPDDVEAMFTTSQSSSDPGVVLANVAGKAASGVYQLTNISQTAGTVTQDGIPMTLSGTSFAPGKNSLAAGLLVQLTAGAGTSATVTINQGLGGALQAISDGLLGTNGALTAFTTTLNKTQSSLADQLSKLDDQVTVYHDQLVTKFTQMNTLVSGYKATQSYLTQQVAMWTKSDN